MAVTKAQLSERKRGKGGTLVRISGRDGTFVVKDLMQRKQYDRPDRIGVGPEDRGIAFGVSLSEVDSVSIPPNGSAASSSQR